jgi:hypothetical protein
MRQLMHTEKWEPSPTIEVRDVNPNVKMPLHPRALNDGGIHIKDEGDVMRTSVKKMIGGVAEKALRGEFGDLFKMSMPAQMHAPYSYIQTAANDTALCGTHLRNAAKTEDPLERLKWLCAFYIGMFHRGPTFCMARVPFNPILGETV